MNMEKCMHKKYIKQFDILIYICTYQIFMYEKTKDISKDNI